MKKILFIILFLLSTNLRAEGYDVFGIGYYDVKFDGTASNEAIDFRYERRFEDSLFDIGPGKEVFYSLKPFAGLEITSDSASYFLFGIYLHEEPGTLFDENLSRFLITPSFGGGFYNDGDGKQLGHSIEFRTTLEISYQLKNKNRIGLSFGHISNANIGDKNPGAEIISLSYQIPY